MKTIIYLLFILQGFSFLAGIYLLFIGYIVEGFVVIIVIFGSIGINLDSLQKQNKLE